MTLQTFNAASTVPASCLSQFMLMVKSSAPKEVVPDVLSVQGAGFSKDKCVLTLTSSPRVCLQCSLSLGNTLSLRALRSTTLSTQSRNTNKIHLTYSHNNSSNMNKKQLHTAFCYFNIMNHLRTLWVGAQIEFHTGRAAGGLWRRPVHLFSSGARAKSPAIVKIRKNDGRKLLTFNDPNK